MRLSSCFDRPLVAVTVATFLIIMHARAAEPPVALPIMPLPASVRLLADRVPVDARFTVAIVGARDDALIAAVNRTLRRWEERTGLVFARTPHGPYAFATETDGASLIIDCAATRSALPQLGEDESYTLHLAGTQVRLRAPTTLGAHRGLATLQQLLDGDTGGWFLPAAEIEDRPRFPWRGLMIDVCRHWQPIEVIKRNLDGMALTKLNVLHLHLSDDQGFRIESKTYPRLHELGSDGDYFTHAQIREIVAYAAARGIRVVPEFDLPGHAQSWVVGHPELASAPGPYTIERRWGVFDPVLDPTNEATYRFLENLLAEMVPLFPDPFFHIGGDENNGVQWSANPRIQAFIKTHDLHDNEGLHAYFNGRVQALLAKHGRSLVGWDEILHPDLPKSAVIHSWRGPAGLSAAARAGHRVILSNGYYIDLAHPARDHYLNDPLPSGHALTPEEQARVLGGEATLWSEWASPETIDSRIWPRTAAIAERLWSPATVNDVDAMYRRLPYVSRRLTEAGLLHEANREPMLRRYAGDHVEPAGLATLRELVALVQPVQGYRRGRYQTGTQFLPLTGLADCAQPDSASARAFARATDDVLFEGAAPATLTPHLAGWRDLAARVSAAAPATGPRAGELSALATQLADAAEAGARLVSQLSQRPPLAKPSSTTSSPVNAVERTAGSNPDHGGRASFDAMQTRLSRIAEPQAAVELPIVQPLKRLAAAVLAADERGNLSVEAWRTRLEELAFPKESP